VVSSVAVLLVASGSVDVPLTAAPTTIENPPGLGAFQVRRIVGPSPRSRPVRVQVTAPAAGAGHTQPEPTALKNEPSFAGAPPTSRHARREPSVDQSWTAREPAPCIDRAPIGHRSGIDRAE
jgi:hypothetical protein